MTATVAVQHENERIGAEVRAWMARRELRQIDVADVLGVAQKNVSRRLRGEIPFRIDELLTLARFMGITLAQLLGEEIVNEKNPQPVAEGSSILVAGGGFEPPTSGVWIQTKKDSRPYLIGGDEYRMSPALSLMWGSAKLTVDYRHFPFVLYILGVHIKCAPGSRAARSGAAPRRRGRCSTARSCPRRGRTARRARRRALRRRE